MSAEVKSIDIKKAKEVADQAFSLQHIQGLVTEVKNEIHKITWTDREELIFYTKIVVFSTLFFGLSIYGLDLAIQTILHGLSLFIQLVGG